MQLTDLELIQMYNPKATRVNKAHADKLRLIYDWGRARSAAVVNAHANLMEKSSFYSEDEVTATTRAAKMVWLDTTMAIDFVKNPRVRLSHDDNSDDDPQEH